MSYMFFWQPSECLQSYVTIMTSCFSRNKICDDDVQEDVVSVDEKIKRDSFLSPKEQVRRTVSDDDPLQHQQPPHQLPSLTTHHVSQANADFTLLSPVSAC